MRMINDEKAFIREIQRFLIRVTPSGEALLWESGYYDESTRAALKRFKTDNGLAADTVVDYETFDLLYKKYKRADADERKTLKRGDRGDDVLNLNMHLLAVGKEYSEFTAYPVSDYYSEDTQNAVLFMKERFYMEVDGDADGAFAKRLKAEYDIITAFKEKT